MKLKLIKVAIICLWLVLFFLPADFLFAAKVEPPKLHVDIGNTELQFDTISCEPGQECDIGWISQYIIAIYKYGIILAAVLTAVMIMVGGFLWLMSGGSSNRVSKAKEFITNALMGLLLALFSYMLLYTVNPRLTALGPISVYAPKEIEFEGPSWTIGGGGGGTGGAAQCTGNTCIVGDYNFTGYAESPTHVQGVNQYYQQMAGRINDANDAQRFIDQFSRGSSATGQMVMDAARDYGVDPAVIIAEMAQDSSIGTAGWATRTNNPGNVGNWGTLQEGDVVQVTQNDDENYTQSRVTSSSGDITYNERVYDSWQDGVNAVADWLNRHRAS